jgi:hypothetical protein
VFSAATANHGQNALRNAYPLWYSSGEAIRTAGPKSIHSGARAIAIPYFGIGDTAFCPQANAEDQGERQRILALSTLLLFRTTLIYLKHQGATIAMLRTILSAGPRGLNHNLPENSIPVALVK